MPRFRPRLSLLTALLFMTIAGMALVIARLWREVGPLRGEVRELRQFVGELSIDDKTKILAIEVRQPDPNFWHWRVYLPPGKEYKLLQFDGLLPPRGKLSNKDWLAALRKAPVNKSESTGEQFEGEFTIDTTLTPVGDTWKLEMFYLDGTMDARYAFQDNWPAERFRNEASDIWPLHQREYEPGEPIRGVRGRVRPSISNKPAEGIALWLEPPALNKP
jgi:hypothetical protein